ncbi:MAG: hypothetical protein ACOY3Y_01890 [Acidobacteriota bacterium]
MLAALERTNRFLERPLEMTPRVLLVTAALLLVPALVVPLWTMTMFAPQYPDGLRLYIHADRLVGGNRDQDIKEINVLNHYIGMRDLSTADFTEFKWMPFVLGGIGLLLLRAAVLGKTSKLVDVLVIYCYFGAFSLWSFAGKMYRYGHELAPTASVKVEPFMPPLFGYEKLANFEVYSYPALGSYLLFAVAGLLLGALWLDWRAARVGPGGGERPS